MIALKISTFLASIESLQVSSTYRRLFFRNICTSYEKDYFVELRKNHVCRFMSVQGTYIVHLLFYVPQLHWTIYQHNYFFSLSHT